MTIARRSKADDQSHPRHCSQRDVARLLVPMFVDAHHSDVMFEEKKEITVQGVVKEFQFTNPHSWLLVDVTNKDGSVTTWGFEAEGPTR